MSNNDISNIYKENFNLKNEKKKKEKETSNLLEENKILNKPSYFSFINLEKDNELICFILLLLFLFIVYILTKLKPAKYGVFEIVGDKILENSFFHENGYRNFYPEISLESINEFPTLEQIFNSRILYLFNRTNITNKYLRHIRPIQYKEEEKFRKELYPNVMPNETFSEKRANFINTKKYIDLCNKGNLINTEIVSSKDRPLISIILPIYNKKNEITKTIRSIQNQSLKNIEIIIVDDFSSENSTDIYQKLLNNDKRIRVFYHMYNAGEFRTRLDGFLYSRGKYILFFNPGDLFSDNLVLEDMYKLITKYNLDSIRFAFKKYKIKENNQYKVMTYIYPDKDLKIKYGKISYKTGYKNICNRLIRANLIIKGLDLIDINILNAYENIWGDVWWNEMVNAKIFGHVIVNRIGFIFFSPQYDEKDIKISTEVERDNTIKEFIYSWLFDYQLTQPDDSKKAIINTLKKYNSHNNKYNKKPIYLDYLKTNFTIYSHFLNLLIDDYFIDDIDKKFVSQLLRNYTYKLKNKAYYLNNKNITLNNEL